AERETALLEPLDALGERLTVVALGGLRAGFVEPAPCFDRLGLDPCELDLDRARALRGLRGLAPQLDLLRAERAQRLAELLCAVRPGVDPSAHRRLEAAARLNCRLERAGRAVGEQCKPRRDDGIQPARRQGVELGPRRCSPRLRL